MRSVRAGAVVALLTTILFGVASAPALAASLRAVVQISAGQNHACALVATGRVRCWGDNTYGQIGDGSTDDRGRAVLVKNPAGTGPLTGVARITAGPQDVCAILRSGQLRCWGANGGGQLGDGTKADRSLPVTVLNPAGTGPLRHVVAVAPADSHTCALLRSGRVFCWGNNTHGGLGDGTNDEHLLPVPVNDPSGTGLLAGVARLDSGLEQTCARLGSGRARCWGMGTNGELGHGEPKVDSSLPVAVLAATGTGPLSGVLTLDGTEYYTCASLRSGQARCWGYGTDGVLGNGHADDHSLPVVVLGAPGTGALRGVTSVAGGGSHTCALLTSHRARCWGANDHAQLGTGATSDPQDRAVVVRSAGGGPLRRIAQLAVGYAFSCARLTSARVVCWGTNVSGQLGDGTFSESPVPVAVKG